MPKVTTETFRKNIIKKIPVVLRFEASGGDIRVAEGQMKEVMKYVAELEAKVAVLEAELAFAERALDDALIDLWPHALIRDHRRIGEDWRAAKRYYTDPQSPPGEGEKR